LNYLQLIFFSVILLLFVSTFSLQDADAWKPNTHIYAAEQAINNIMAGNNVVIINNGQGPQQYTVDPIVANAIRQYPQYYIGGVVGPDAFPDIYVGQGIIHPDNRCYDGTIELAECKLPGRGDTFTHQWLRHVYNSGWAYYNAHPNTPEGKQVLAFTYGFLTHGAGDMWAHTLVNEYSLGVFPLVSDMKSSASKAAIGATHIVVEGYVGQFTPPTQNTRLEAPIGFIHDTFIVNAGAFALGNGDTFKSFKDLKSKLQTEKAKLKDERDDFLANVGVDYNDIKNDMTALFSCVVNFYKDIGCALDTVIDCAVSTLSFGLFGDDCISVPDLAAPIKREAKIIYINAWIADIDQGLKKWPLFSRDLANALFLEPDPTNPTKLGNTAHAKNILKDFILGTGPYHPGYLSMRGAPDVTGDVINLIGNIASFVGNIVSFVIPDPIEEFVDKAEDWLILVAFGFDMDTLVDLFKNPNSYMDNPNKTIRLFHGLEISLNITPDTKPKLDQLMGPHSPYFNPDNFKAIKNTITISKLILLSPDKLNQVLCDNRVGPIYGEFAEFYCSEPFELPAMPPFAEVCDRDDTYVPPTGGLVDPRGFGTTLLGIEICDQIPINWDCTTEEVLRRPNSDEGEFSFDASRIDLSGFILSTQEASTLGDEIDAIVWSNGTANIAIISDKLSYHISDGIANFTVWIEPITSDSPIQFTVRDGSGNVKTINTFYGPGQNSFKCTDVPRANFILNLNSISSQGNWKVTATYINAKAELHFPPLNVDKPVRSENAMLDFVRSIDGNQQWRIDGTQNNPTGSRQFSEGMPIWSDCPARDRVFRNVFTDWDHSTYSNLNFPDEGEKAKPSISLTRPPISWLRVYGETSLFVGIGDLVVLVSPSTTYEVYTKHEYGIPSSGGVSDIETGITIFNEKIWDVSNNEVLTYAKKTGTSSSLPSYGSYGSPSIGPKSFGPYQNYLGEIAINFYDAGKCSSNISEGLVEEHLHSADFCYYDTSVVEVGPIDCRTGSSVLTKPLSKIPQKFDRDIIRYEQAIEILGGRIDITNINNPLCDPTHCDPLDLGTNPRELTKLGLKLDLGGHLPEAAWVISKARELAPDNPSIPTAWGNVLVKNDRIDEAITNFDKALSIEPKSSLALIGRGNALHLQGNLDDARTNFDSAIKLSPKNTLALVGRGDVLIEQGEFEEAAKTFDVAIKLEPKNALPRVGKGTVEFSQGKTDLAISTLQKAAELDPNVLKNQIFQKPGIMPQPSIMQQGIMQKSLIVGQTTLLQNSALLQNSILQEIEEIPTESKQAPTIQKTSKIPFEEDTNFQLILVVAIIGFGLAMGIIPAVLRKKKVNN